MSVVQPSKKLDSNVLIGIMKFNMIKVLYSSPAKYKTLYFNLTIMADCRGNSPAEFKICTSTPINTKTKIHMKQSTKPYISNLNLM